MKINWIKCSEQMPPDDEIIAKFEENLLDNMEDLEPEFQKILDENYWDLI